eukprot:Gb_13463 [translate_table: standard]
MPENNNEQHRLFGSWRHRASQFYLLLILFAFPLFSIPCPKGSCSSPVEVVAVHLVMAGVNDAIVKVILYPGALFSKMESIVAEEQPMSLPDSKYLLDNISTSLKEKKQGDKNFGWGLIIGSYLCLAGAVACVLGPTSFSALGPLVLLWSIYNEGGAHENAYALPMFSVALFCALSGTKLLGSVSRKANISGPSNDSTTSSDEKTRPSSSDKKAK